MAGLTVLLSAILAWLVSPDWPLLTAFVGLNRMQASSHRVLSGGGDFSRPGLKPGCAFGGSTRALAQV